MEVGRKSNSERLKTLELWRKRCPVSSKSGAVLTVFYGLALRCTLW
jgi:hypothetical protein